MGTDDDNPRRASRYDRLRPEAAIAEMMDEEAAVDAWRTEQAARHERVYEVTHEASLVLDYDPTGHGDLPADPLGDLLNGLAEDFITKDGEGDDSRDAAVWHAGRLVAVVRLGADGKPQATRFDGQS